MKSNLISRFAALVLLIVMASCGGGDSGDSNDNNQGGGSPGFSLITQPKPQPTPVSAAPQNLTVTRSGINLTITWEAPVGSDLSPTTYEVLYCESRIGESCVPTRVLATTQETSMTHQAKRGIQRTYSVRVVDGEGAVSASYSIEIPYEVPPKLTLTVTQGPVETGVPVTIQWNPSSVPVQHYRLTRCLNGRCTTETLHGTTHSPSFNQPGTYTFQVVAVNPGGVAGQPSVAQSVVVEMPQRAPTAPRNLTVHATGLTIAVTWNTPEDSSTDTVRYTVEYCESNHGVSCTPSSTLTHSGLQATYTGSHGKRYTFKVTAESNAGSSSALYSIEIPYEVPPKLTLTVTQGPVETGVPVTIQWNPSSVPVQHYRLTRCLNGRCTTETLHGTTHSPSFNQPGTYTFQVVAVNPGGVAGQPSVAQSVVVEMPQRAPTAPRDLTVHATGLTLAVTWNAPEDSGTDTVRYTVEYCESNHGVSCTPSSTLTHSGLQATYTGSHGKRYTFRVTAESNAGSSSDSRSVEIPYQVSPQLTLTVTPGPVETGVPVTVQWNPSPVPVRHYVLTHCLYGWCDTETLNVTTHIRSLADPGTHTFQVVAVNPGDVENQPSAPRSVEVLTPPPLSAPENVRVILDPEDGRYTIISWDHPRDNGGSLIVEYRVHSSARCPIPLSEPFRAFGGSITESRILVGYSYGRSQLCYVVEAINARGDSARSEGVVVMLRSPPQPSAPENVRVVLAPLLDPEDDQYAIISWDHPRDNGGSIIVEYRVYSSIYCPVPLSESPSAYLEGSVTEFRVQVTYNYGALPQLCYAVEAENADGDTARSEGVVVTLRVPPEPDPGPCGKHYLEPPDCVPNPSELHNRSVMIEALEKSGTLLGSENAVTVDIDGNEEFRFVVIDSNTISGFFGVSNHGNRVLQAFCYHRPGNCVINADSEEPWYRSVTPPNAQRFLRYYDVGSTVGVRDAYRLTTEEQIVSISSSWFPSEEDLRNHGWIVRAGANEELSDPEPSTLVQGYLDILEATRVALTVTRPDGSGGTMEVEVEVPKSYTITGYLYNEESEMFEPGGSECGRLAEYCIRGPRSVGSIYNPEEDTFFAFTLGNSYAAPAITAAIDGTLRLWPDLSNAELFYLLGQCSSIPTHVSQNTEEEQERAEEVWGLGVLDLACLTDPSDVLTVNDELATGSIAAAARSLVTLGAEDGIGRDYNLELPGMGEPLTVSHLNVSGLRGVSHVSATGITQLSLLNLPVTEGLAIRPLFEQEEEGGIPNTTGIAFTYEEELWESWIAFSYRTPTTFFGTSPGTGAFDPGTLREFTVGMQATYTPRTDTSISLGLTCTQAYAEGTPTVRELSGFGCAANTGVGFNLGQVRLSVGLSASQVFDTVYRIFDGSQEHRIALNQDLNMAVQATLSIPF